MSEGIKHYKFKRKDGTFVYLCNWAVTSNENKMTENLLDVTCKNCRRLNIKDKLEKDKK